MCHGTAHEVPVGLRGWTGARRFGHRGLSRYYDVGVTCCCRAGSRSHGPSRNGVRPAYPTPTSNNLLDVAADGSADGTSPLDGVSVLDSSDVADAPRDRTDVAPPMDMPMVDVPRDVPPEVAPDVPLVDVLPDVPVVDVPPDVPVDDAPRMRRQWMC